MSAQSSRLPSDKSGGEVLQFDSVRSSDPKHYELMFRKSINFYLQSIEDIQSQIQQYQHSIQTFVQLARTLLSSNEIILSNSTNLSYNVANELSNRREAVGEFLFEQLSSHVSLSKQKTDSILDLYNSSVSIAKLVSKLNRFTSICSMNILNYTNLSNEMTRGKSNPSSISFFAKEAGDAWERANKSVAAAQGLASGLMTLSQNIFESYQISKQITDRMIELSNSVAQYAGMN